MKLFPTIFLLLSVYSAEKDTNLSDSSNNNELHEHRGLRWNGWGNGGGNGGGGGRGGGGNGGGGGGGNSGNMNTIHKLLDVRDDLSRTVTQTSNGVETYTWSDNNSQASTWLKQHVKQMDSLVKSGGRIRNWDPFFDAIFDHRDEIDLDYEETLDGMHVSLTGKTACGTSLAQKHAAVVSAFINRGRNEVRREHSVPDEC